MAGYVSVGAHRAARSNSIVAILAKHGKGKKTSVVTEKATYYSKASPRRLAERLEGGEEKNSYFKKSE